MTRQTTLSAATLAPAGGTPRARPRATMPARPKTIKFLIANLELEFRPTHRKISLLRISNRKYLAIFQPRRTGTTFPPRFLPGFQRPTSSFQNLIETPRLEIRANSTKQRYLPISNRDKTGLLFSRISVGGRLGGALHESQSRITSHESQSAAGSAAETRLSAATPRRARRFSRLARTNAAKSGCGARGLDLNSG